MFGCLYYLWYELINVYFLLYFLEVVRDFGFLYCYFLFGFEGLNGNLFKFVYGI